MNFFLIAYGSSQEQVHIRLLDIAIKERDRHPFFRKMPREGKRNCGLPHPAFTAGNRYIHLCFSIYEKDFLTASAGQATPGQDSRLSSSPGNHAMAFCGHAATHNPHLIHNS
jgi:hypothetical protein